MKPALLNRPRDLRGRAGEIFVIAVGVAGKMTPHDVMKIVGPDRVDAPAAEADRIHQHGKVA